MSLPKIATRRMARCPQGTARRRKGLTRQRDSLNTERRNLSMVEVEKDYVFDGPNG